MNEDDEAAALAHQQECEQQEWEHRWSLDSIMDMLVDEARRIAQKRKQWFGGDK